MNVVTSRDNNSEVQVNFPCSLTTKLFHVAGQPISTDSKPSSSSDGTRTHCIIIHYITLTSIKVHYVNANGSVSINAKVNYIGI